MKQKVLATWIVNDTKVEQSWFPQAGKIQSDNPQVHFMYWRCVADFFACASRTCGDSCRLVLFTNRPIAAPDIKNFLVSLGVEVIVVPLAHLPPVGYHGSWRNQFYILDLIQYLAKTAENESYVILDSDCVINKSLDPLYQELTQKGALLYSMSYSEEHSINGLTRVEMKALYEEISGEPLTEIPRYCGGEFFAATSEAIRAMAELSEAIWRECMDRFELGKAKFNEEAHFLSYLYFRLGFEHDTANRFIKRLWTQFSYRNVEPQDYELAIWHVPAEKRYGFKRLYRVIRKRDSWFWKMPAVDRWRARIGVMLGIPAFGTHKKLQDLGNRVLAKVLKSSI